MLFATYVLSMCAAAAVLWIFGTRRWYWHAVALLAALVVGLIPALPFWSGPSFYYVTGCLFLFLFTWGIGAAVAALMRYERTHGTGIRTFAAGGHERF